MNLMKKILIIFVISIFSQVITQNVFAGSDGTLKIGKKSKEQNNEVKDCFETVNRGIFAFNQGLDKIFFKPVAKGYRYLPKPIRSGTSNALSNLSNVVTIPNNILGHSDIAPLRKIDPGEKFPWKFLSKNKIGIWHNINSKILKSNRRKNSELNLHKFTVYLKKLGYNIEYSNSGELSKFIKIFQMRFRPELIDGKLDLECFYIAKSLYKLE